MKFPIIMENKFHVPNHQPDRYDSSQVGIPSGKHNLADAWTVLPCPGVFNCMKVRLHKSTNRSIFQEFTNGTLIPFKPRFRKGISGEYSSRTVIICSNFSSALGFLGGAANESPQNLSLQFCPISLAKCPCLFTIFHAFKMVKLLIHPKVETSSNSPSSSALPEHRDLRVCRQADFHRIVQCCGWTEDDTWRQLRSRTWRTWRTWDTGSGMENTGLRDMSYKLVITWIWPIFFTLGDITHVCGCELLLSGRQNTANRANHNDPQIRNTPPKTKQNGHDH